MAVVLLVYDHHVTKLTEKLLHLQHSHLLETTCTLHVHLDHHHCLEIIVLRGKVKEINRVGEQMISLKGVRQGRIQLMTAELISEKVKKSKSVEESQSGESGCRRVRGAFAGVWVPESGRQQHKLAPATDS
jgi:hypothetical protein